MFDTRINLYGICIVLSILLGVFVFYKNSKFLKLRKDELIGLFIYILIGTIFGAMMFSYLTDLKNNNGVFSIKEVGLSSYGAVIGVLLMILLFSKQFNKKYTDILYAMVPSLPLMYAVGKIGCFLAGCCYGIKYSGPLAVTYYHSLSAPSGVSLFPIQIVESIVFFIIFLILPKQKYDRLYVLGLAFTYCGVAKFLLEYLRMSSVGKIISVNQVVSLIFIIIGIILLIKNPKHDILY